MYSPVIYEWFVYVDLNLFWFYSSFNFKSNEKRLYNCFYL